VSEEAPIGLTVAEKFFGLLVMVLGIITVYYTVTSPPTGDVAPFSGIFTAAGFILIGIGVFLLFSKIK